MQGDPALACKWRVKKKSGLIRFDSIGGVGWGGVGWGGVERVGSPSKKEQHGARMATQLHVVEEKNAQETEVLLVLILWVLAHIVLDFA